MYDILPSFVLGFHGCDASIAEQVFAGEIEPLPSTNEYDWLGHGIYFWEHNPMRALEYAISLMAHPQRSRHNVVTTPAVVGAVIDLGRCLNLLDAHFLAIVKDGYSSLRSYYESKGWPLPRNKPVDESGDLLLRNLDCAVIEMVHATCNESPISPFDTVRGVFVEGEPLYEGAGIHARTHIQVCVRNPQNIKGYFRVRS